MENTPNQDVRDFSKIKKGLIIEVFCDVCKYRTGWFKAEVTFVGKDGFYSRGIDEKIRGGHVGLLFQSPYWRFVSTAVD